MSDQTDPAAADPELQEVRALVLAQLGEDTFEDLDVVRNPSYPEAISHPTYAVVPFQVRGFRQVGRLAGVAPTGRSTVVEGVAMRGADGRWELFVDSMGILADLGVPVAMRPASPTEPIEPVPPVPSTIGLGRAQAAEFEN